jgi:hypothetical protein
MSNVPNKFQTNQSGISSSLLLVGAGLLVVLFAGVFVYFLITNPNQVSLTKTSTQEKEQKSKPSPTSKVNKKDECESTDYGGCDDDPNFYQWEDDNLRK